jgi:glycosyltransferase involved in cell wall biosynthesis
VRLPSLPIDRLRVFHVGGYWRGPNDMVRQMMLGLGSAGAEVFEYCTDDHPEALDTDGLPYDRGTTGPVWLRWEHLRGPLAEADPHLVICNAGGLSFRPENAAMLRQRLCLLGVALSDPDVFEAATRHIARNFDLFLTNAPTLVEVYRGLGIPAAVVPAATHEEFFRPVPPRPELRCEVLVLGRAHPDRVEPVRALVQAFDTHVYGEGWEEHGVASRGIILGEDALAALASADVTVVFYLMGSGYPLVKVGLFDFLAAGALVATNRSPLVEGYLAFEEELVGFGSTPELLAQVRRVLDSPAEAARIREAGRARVLRDYTWKAAWPGVLRRLQELPA